MAMTMSSSMPPTATNGGRRRTTTSANTALGNRRRRPPTAPAASAAAHNQEEEEEEEKREETDADGNLQRSVGPSVRFAHFDTELEDSDQTITGVAQRWNSRSLLTNRRRFETTPVAFRPKSTFFPDSTDDETMSAYKAATKTATSISSTTTATMNADRAGGASSTGGLPTFPVIHIGEIQFPVTRTVLWDRRVLAGPFTITTTDVLPRLRLCNSLLKLLHAQLTHDTTQNAATTTRRQPQPRLLGYATGECTASGLLTLTQLVHHKPDNAGRSAASSCMIPIHRTKLSYPEDVAQSHQEMIHAARATFETTSGTSSRRDGAFDIQASAVVSISRERSRAEIDVELDAIVPDVRLAFRLIRSLPLLMTPLAASLLRCEFGNETQRFGFLTLDRARKAVPLLETDPLVLQRPIVGIWVYGVAVEDDAATADTIRVADPFLFQSCVRFLASKIIKERAQVDAGTFLVAVYPGSAAGPLPRFFECQVVGATAGGVSPQVSWRKAHARGQCLAGVASFKGDLDIAMVFSPDEAAAPAASTAPPVSLAHPVRDAPALETLRSQRTAQETIPARAPTHDRVREPGESTTNAYSRSSAARAETNTPGSMQSCCRSQQLLAAQHQEMLEHQQRQLREMQDQIAQLQLVLTETRAENARLLAASSSRFSGSSIGDSDHDQDTQEVGDNTIDSAANDVDPVPAYSRVNADDDRGAVQSDDKTNGADEAAVLDKRDQDESFASSLALSSISQRSDQSDLSSVSSSVVGARLKTLFLTEEDDQEENAAESQHVDQNPKLMGATQDLQEASDVTEGLRTEERATEQEHTRPVEQTTSCPYQYIPSARHNNPKMRARAQCERDEFEDESDASRIDDLLAERLHIPSTPNREEIVRGGALATFGFSHGSSFSIPKIKYVPETVTCDSDEDDEEEVRRIELKYRKRLAHTRR